MLFTSAKLILINEGFLVEDKSKLIFFAKVKEFEGKKGRYCHGAVFKDFIWGWI